MYRPDRVASALSVDTSCCVRATGAGICVHACVWRGRARQREIEQQSERRGKRKREAEKMSENEKGR